MLSDSIPTEARERGEPPVYQPVLLAPVSVLMP
jgi:hypothetical protein